MVARALRCHRAVLMSCAAAALLAAGTASGHRAAGGTAGSRGLQACVLARLSRSQPAGGAAYRASVAGAAAGRVRAAAAGVLRMRGGAGDDFDYYQVGPLRSA
jgi:hypothetical protein